MMNYCIKIYTVRPLVFEIPIGHRSRMNHLFYLLLALAFIVCFLERKRLSYLVSAVNDARNKLVMDVRAGSPRIR